MSFFNTKKSNNSKSKFEGIIDSGFKAIILGGTVSIAVTVPMLAYTLRHSIEAAFTAGFMQDILYFVAGFSVFVVIMATITIRSIANAYVKANALNAMATKQQATQAVQPQIIFAPSGQPQQEPKRLEAKGEWAMNEVDQIPVIEATSQRTGQPFIF